MGNIQLPLSGTISGIAEQNGINTALAAVMTMMQGATAPNAATSGLASMAGVWWHNTSNGQISVRNQADTQWVAIGTINETTNTFTPAGLAGASFLPLSGGTLTGTLTISLGGVVVSAGGLSVQAGGAAVTGNSSVTGNFSVSGTLNVSGIATFAGAASFGGQVSVPVTGVKFSDGTVQNTAPNFSGYATSTQLGAYAPLASPAFTGHPTAPTQVVSVGDTGNSQLATIAYVWDAIAANFGYSSYADYQAFLASSGSSGGGGGGG